MPSRRRGGQSGQTGGSVNGREIKNIGIAALQYRCRERLFAIREKHVLLSDLVYTSGVKATDWVGILTGTIIAASVQLSSVTLLTTIHDKAPKQALQANQSDPSEQFIIDPRQTPIGYKCPRACYPGAHLG
jgi:hypothetical protein